MASASPFPIPFISGVGAYLPERTVSSEALDAEHGLKSGWIYRNCGVRQRHVVSAHETQEMMGAQAARDALAEAGVAPDELDLILFAAAVGRQPIPATAPLIKRALGAAASPFPAYDVNATCLSALVAMDVAAMHIASGRARHVLVVSSEIATRALPWRSDPRTAGLFGDGAAALVLSAGAGAEARRVGPFLIETYADGYEYCELRSGGTRFDFQREREAFEANALFAMQGAALYRLTSEAAPGFIERLLARAGWTQDQVDLVVPHQASPHALAHIVKRCGFAKERVIDHVAELGNQVAASLPIALFKACEKRRLEPGMKVLLIGTSAGVSLGGATMVA
ncbi:MAG TPA: 3-oxoacyl-[acyl-carrier-protein] synthase III C-terminal domain-containing protein [Vitreimonas sp.]|uniref:3-oxoacyl-ACP synthase III family protein n=1 Tax=Vitreimonas sp. TaxID=3069702 RepID=UPI002D5C9262|nr:3-oxoacyl-[acyl-carrier-protein] synthase III C-terminal domain-containing protein [Vitreimonas sp.]HYD88078.1 3-oxoacyl-[acyl-carrier-protein] synthase III C-terminal domain-containing protein [Vitreimonas sp.]